MALSSMAPVADTNVNRAPPLTYTHPPTHSRTHARTHAPPPPTHPLTVAMALATLARGVVEVVSVRLAAAVADGLEAGGAQEHLGSDLGNLGGRQHPSEPHEPLDDRDRAQHQIACSNQQPPRESAIKLHLLHKYTPAMARDPINRVQVVLAAVGQDGWALQHAMGGLWIDRDVVLAAVAQDGMVLRHAGPHRTDREVVHVAVAQNNKALRLARLHVP